MIDAFFTEDFRGAYCKTPKGAQVSVQHRHTPVYDLARELARLGYGRHILQSHTPNGIPSLRGRVAALAKLRVEESQKRGLRLRKEGDRLT